MRKLLIIPTCLLLLAACDNAAVKPPETLATATLPTESHTDREIMTLLERGNFLTERTRQVTAIQTVFSRHTTPERARNLAALCFSKTSGTPFMPFDLAEIALAETGGNRLSGKAVSPRGARGVWQVMPERARSHGFTAQDMTVDEKCAEAAVRELFTKLEMAQGDLERAKKLYCGQGPQANAYLKKVRNYRSEMHSVLEQAQKRMASASMAQPTFRTR